MIVRREDAWTRRPEDPRTVWGWIFRRRFEVASFDRKQFAIGAFVMSVMIGGIYLVKTLMGKTFDPITVAIVPFVVLSKTWKWRHPAAEAHAALPTLTDGTDALAVALTIFDEDGRITGRDYGWVAFADGWLVYEGLRTTFSLTKASTGHPSYPPAGIALCLSDRRRIQLAIVAGSVQPDLSLRHAVHSLHEATRAWFQAPIPEGDSIPPPRRDHPEVVVERLAFPPTFALFSLFLAALANWWGGLSLAAPFLAAAAGCALWLLFGLYRFWRALPSLTR